MPEKLTRLTVNVEEYDASKIQQACLLSPEEAAVTSDVLKRCGLSAQVDKVEGPLFTFGYDREGSVMETNLRTVDEVVELLPEFDPVALKKTLASLTPKNSELKLENSNAGGKTGILIELEPGPDFPYPLPDVPSVPTKFPIGVGAGSGKTDVAHRR